MIVLLLLLSAMGGGKAVLAPVENPLFAPIYVESCTTLEPRQAITYPPELVGTEVYGKVELVLFLNPCGQVRHVIVSKSSGTPVLDTAAVESAKSWVISPDLANLQPGRGGIVRLPIEFKAASGL